MAFRNRPAGRTAESAISNMESAIFEVIEQMLDLGLSDRDSCLEMKEKLEANTFNLVVVGQFKRGKTCLINALLGADILPVSVVPLTSIVTVLVYGETPGAKVFFKNGKTVDIPVESLSDYVTETGNPKNEKEVSRSWSFIPRHTSRTAFGWWTPRASGPSTFTIPTLHTATFPNPTQPSFCSPSTSLRAALKSNFSETFANTRAGYFSF